MNWPALVISAVAGLLLASCAPQSAAPPAATSVPPGAVAAPTVGVQTFEDQGRGHLAQGQAPPRYNSNPPTSGTHAPTVMAWGIHERLSPKEVLIHNMEHGGVVVWYNCQAAPALSSAQCTELKSRLGRVVQTAIDAKKLIVMGPYPDMNRRIALTSWGTLDAFEEFDAIRVARFIDTYERAFNPEGF